MKTIKRAGPPGIFVTSSAFPVAPISSKEAKSDFASRAKSPDSMAMPPFVLVLTRPTTRRSSLTRPSEILSVVIGASVIDVLVGSHYEALAFTR